MRKIHILHFYLQNNIRCCINIKYINKVISLVQLETIPGSPSYVVGLINISGTSMPVIDLALRLGLDRTQSYSLDTPILICSDGPLQMGILVDKIIGLSLVDEDALQMHNEFDKPNSPFLGTTIEKDELSLLINIKNILKINLTNETDTTLDKSIIEMIKT